MWSSDVALAEEEAERRYSETPTPERVEHVAQALYDATAPERRVHWPNGLVIDWADLAAWYREDYARMARAALAAWGEGT